jgi:hypothetical protein
LVCGEILVFYYSWGKNAEDRGYLKKFCAVFGDVCSCICLSLVKVGFSSFIFAVIQGSLALYVSFCVVPFYFLMCWEKVWFVNRIIFIIYLGLVYLQKLAITSPTCCGRSVAGSDHGVFVVFLSRFGCLRRSRIVQLFLQRAVISEQ